jgi:hypothetical protein
MSAKILAAVNTVSAGAVTSVTQVATALNYTGYCTPQYTGYYTLHYTGYCTVQYTGYR